MTGGAAVRSVWLGVVTAVGLTGTARAQSVPVPPTDGAPLSFDAAELADLPGSFGDPLRGVMLLPGVSHVASGVAQPVVRGASPSATGVYLDGVRLPMLGHLLLGPTVVQPGLVSGVAVHRGAAPARLGRDAGGAVELAMQPGGSRLQASVDLLNVGALAEGVVGPAGTEVMLAGRFAWSPWLATTALNALRGGSSTSSLLANLFDYQARVGQRLGGTELRVLALGAGDAVGLEGGSPGVRAGLGFHRVDVRARSQVGAGRLEAGLTLGLDTLDAAGGGHLSQVASALTERSVAGRLGLTLPLAAGLELRAGADADVRGVDVRQTNTVVPASTDGAEAAPVVSSVLQPVARATYAGLWAEGEARVGQWRVVPGLRLDGYALAGQATRGVLEPRLLVQRRLGEGLGLRVAAGLHHQAPAYLVDVPGAESASLRFGLQRVVQTSVGVDWAGAGPWSASVDAFVNPLLRTVELSLFDADFWSVSPAALQQARVGRGLAWGTELLLRRRLADGWTGLLGYTFQQSRRTQQVVRYDATGTAVGTGEATFASGLEQAHVLNAALNVQLGAGWTLGGGVHLNTGAPEAGGLASLTQTPGTSARDGSARWVPVDRDRVGRLPAFFRVDARVAKAWGTGPVQWLAALEVLNASLSREVLRYDYKRSADGTLTRNPAGLPPVTLPMLRVQATY